MPAVTSKLGILAGRGSLPKAVMQACNDTLRPYFVLAFEGQTDPELIIGVPHKWARLGAANDIITTLKREGVSELILVGAMKRPPLSSLTPDWRATKILAKIGWRLGDDGLFKAVIKELESEGFKVIGIEDILPQMITGKGELGKTAPSDAAKDDIKKGIEVLRSLSKMDVGQAVVVQGGMVLGIEAAEGTDDLIKRCQGLQRPGDGAVLVKMRKIGQESRADLPAIGPVTVDNAAAAGFSGIAVEANGTLILEHDLSKTKADKAGIFLYGFQPDDLA